MRPGLAIPDVIATKCAEHEAMTFRVVQRTWSPDSVPGGRHLGTLRIETVATCATLAEAEAAAKASAARYASHGYNKRQGYWWGRDDRFRYTFMVEAP